MEHREKCIRQHVLNVAKNVKFPSNRMVLDLCIARTVIRNIDQRDIKNLFFLFKVLLDLCDQSSVILFQMCESMTTE
jgi:hypothetical protein